MEDKTDFDVVVEKIARRITDKFADAVLAIRDEMYAKLTKLATEGVSDKPVRRTRKKRTMPSFKGLIEQPVEESLNGAETE